MTKTVVFHDTLKNETIVPLIEKLESIIESKTIKLFFSTNGGDNISTEILISFIKENKNIELHFNFELSSNGAYFLMLPNKKVFTKTFKLLMIHLGNVQVNTRELFDDSENYDKIILRDQKKMRNEDLKLFKPILSELEFDRYKHGYDINFDRSRTIKICKELNKK